MHLIQSLWRIGIAMAIAFTLAIATPTPANTYPMITHLATANQVKGSVQQATGKAQETIGNATGDREAQIKGKVKQAEGQIRKHPSDAGDTPVHDNSEAVIVGKTQQAESNIRRFQSRAYQGDVKASQQ